MRPARYFTSQLLNLGLTLTPPSDSLGKRTILLPRSRSRVAGESLRAGLAAGDLHQLVVDELIHAVLAQFAADARALHSAEWQLREGS